MTLTPASRNHCHKPSLTMSAKAGGPGRTRTYDQTVMSGQL